MGKSVIVVDMLDDFVYGKLKCDRGPKIIQPLKKLLAEARKKKVAVIYSNDAHLPVDRELDVWGPHGMKGTKEAEVIKELKPEKGDYEVGKRAYSGFFATDLDMLLRDLKVDTVIIAGLHTNICVRHTSADAFFLGYKVVIPEDGVEAFTEKDYKEGLEYLKMCYKADVKKIDDIIKEF
jgi:nicotinamidase-related amidase